MIGIEGDDSPIPPVPVFLGPRPGATNISLDTVIYVYQTRPVSNNIELDPKTSFFKIENKHDFASRNTIYYPAKLLEPNTIYNVSGSIMGYSAWWTFTTGSSVIPQSEYEYLLPTDVWGIPILVSSVSSLVIIMIILIKKPKYTG